MDKQELFGQLSDAVVDMDEDLVVELSQQVIDAQVDAFEAV